MSEEDDAVVLAAAGEIDLATVPEWEEGLEQVVETDRKRLIVDLSGLQFMDARGLSVLVRATERAQQRGRRFGVVRDGAQVNRLIDMTGALRVLLGDTREELLAQL